MVKAPNQIIFNRGVPRLFDDSRQVAAFKAIILSETGRRHVSVEQQLVLAEHRMKEMPEDEGFCQAIRTKLREYLADIAAQRKQAK